MLVVAERTDAQTWKSLRNVETVHLIAPGQLNTYDVLVSDDVVFTAEALEAFLARTGARQRPSIVEAPRRPVEAAPAEEGAGQEGRRGQAGRSRRGGRRASRRPVVVEEPAGDLDDATLEATTTDELEPDARR